MFIYPRFDEFYLVEDGATYVTWEPRRIDPNLSEGFYESQWEGLMRLRRNVTMIVLYSWNIYGEQTHIEPSYGGPAPVEDEYLDKTQRYYSEFQELVASELLSNLVEIPFQANCRSVRRSRHPVDLAML